MKFQILLSTLFLTFLPLASHAQTPEVIDNDLEVTGTLDVGGNGLKLGSLIDSLTTPALNLNYTDTLLSSSPNVYRGDLNFDHNRQTNKISWRELNSAGSGYNSVLDISTAGTSVNLVTLYGPDPTQTTQRLTLAACGTGASSQIRFHLGRLEPRRRA